MEGIEPPKTTGKDVLLQDPQENPEGCTLRVRLLKRQQQSCGKIRCYLHLKHTSSYARRKPNAAPVSGAAGESIPGPNMKRPD